MRDIDDGAGASRPWPPRTLVALAAVYLVWGSTYLAIKVGVEQLPPLTLSAVRFLLAGAILYVWCAWQRRRDGAAGEERGWSRPTRSQWRAGAVQGLLLPAAGTGGATWAEQRLPSGLTALLLATIPVWMTLLARVVGAGGLPRRAAAGVLLGVVGVAALVNPFAGSAPQAVPTTVALAGACCWAAGSVYATRAPRPAQPLLASAVEMLAGGAGLAVLAGASGEFARVSLGPAAYRSLAAFAYLVVFGSIVAYSAYEYLLHDTGPRIAGTYAFVNPVVAVALGWWLLGEPVTGWTLMATAVIAAAVALIVTADSRHRAPDSDRSLAAQPVGRSART